MLNTCCSFWPWTTYGQDEHLLCIFTSFRVGQNINLPFSEKNSSFRKFFLLFWWRKRKQSWNKQWSSFCVLTSFWESTPNYIFSSVFIWQEKKNAKSWRNVWKWQKGTPETWSKYTTKTTSIRNMLKIKKCRHVKNEQNKTPKSFWYWWIYSQL